MDIRLNFINNSNDANNSQVVIFAKNTATDFDDLAVAWKVIANCGRGDSHPFVYPQGVSVATRDSWGNYTPWLDASHGQRFAVNPTPSGTVLTPAGLSDHPDTLEVLNNLSKGAINASIYKGGKMLAQRISMNPQQKAVFQFKPEIWIGVASQAVEGQAMDPATTSRIDTRLPLLGMASADIVMTGGGPGKSSTPFQFALENVVHA